MSTSTNSCIKIKSLGPKSTFSKKEGQIVILTSLSNKGNKQNQYFLCLQLQTSPNNN